nr:hypothetical protein [Tanacetum cinerariifolium]
TQAPRNHIGGADAQNRFETTSKRSIDPPLSTGHTVGSGEERMEQEADLTDFGKNDDKTEELNVTDGADTKVIVKDNGSGEKDGSATDQVSTARPDVSVITPSTPPTTTTIFSDEDLTIAQTLIKTRSDKEKKKGIAFKDVDDSTRPIRSITTLQPLSTIDPKDKGKGVLVEEEPEKLEKVKRRDQGLAQIKSDADLAKRIYEEELTELDKA